MCVGDERPATVVLPEGLVDGLMAPSGADGGGGGGGEEEEVGLRLYLIDRNVHGEAVEAPVDGAFNTSELHGFRLLSPTVSFSLLGADGTPLQVRNAASLIEIELPADATSEPACAAGAPANCSAVLACSYWDEAASAWSTRGAPSARRAMGVCSACATT